MRIIYESIIDVCAKKIPGMDISCGDEKGGNTILWMLANKHIDNYVLRNFLFSIRKISNPVVHPNNVPLHTDTVNALIYALKDVIRWFAKKICNIQI
jgi:hypothetical protein